MPSASQAVFSAALQWKRFTISMILYLYLFATLFIVFVFENCTCISPCLLSGARARSQRLVVPESRSSSTLGPPQASPATGIPRGGLVNYHLDHHHRHIEC